MLLRSCYLESTNCCQWSHLASMAQVAPYSPESKNAPMLQLFISAGTQDQQLHGPPCGRGGLGGRGVARNPCTSNVFRSSPKPTTCPASLMMNGVSRIREVSAGTTVFKSVIAPLCHTTALGIPVRGSDPLIEAPAISPRSLIPKPALMLSPGSVPMSSIPVPEVHRKA